MSKQTPSQRTVPMEVLALGMSRAGTESVKRALEELGYGRVYHGWELNGSQHGLIWGELTERKYGPNKGPITREHLDRILGAYGGVTEMPCAAFWSELMDAYPEAKIVLVERDMEAWYRSFVTVVVPTVFSWQRDVMTLAMRLGLMPSSPNWFYSTLFKHYFRARNKREMELNARAVYREHYAVVAARAQAEGWPLLRMQLGDGWEPLCKFLGKPVPEKEFPNVNPGAKTVAMVKMYRSRAMMMLLRKVGVMCAIAATVVAACFLVWRWSSISKALKA